MSDRVSWKTTLLYIVVFIPVLGRSFFPMVRDTSSITFQSSLTDPQILGVYVLWAYCIWGFLKRPSCLKLAFVSPLWPLTLLVLVAASSVFTVSRAPMYSLWRSVETCGVLLWGVLVCGQIREGKNPEKLFASFYAMSAAMLLGVVVAVIVDPQHAWMQEENKVERLDVTSTIMMGANTIGVIAALMSLVTLSRCVVLAETRYLIMAGTFLAICYAARSRTGFIVFILGLFVLAGFLVRVPSRRLAASTIGILLGLLVIGLFLVSPEFTELAVSTFTRGHSEENIRSLDGRMSIWTEALKAVEQSPLLGSGYATYPIHVSAGSHFHNMFVELAVTTGLFGLIPVVVWFLLLITRLVRLFLGSPVSSDSFLIHSIDALLIGTVVIVSEMTTAGAAYYSWQMIGVVVLSIGLYKPLDGSPVTEEVKSYIQDDHSVVFVNGRSRWSRCI